KETRRWVDDGGVAHRSTGRPVPARALSERFLELTTDIAGAIGFDGRLVGANPALKQLVGAEVGELASRSAAALLHPDDRAALGGERVAAPGGIVQREKRYLRPDGSEVLAQLSVSAVAGPDGTAQYLIAQMVDVTQQRAAERALAESEQRFRTLAVASPAGIFSLDFKGRLLYAN